MKKAKDRILGIKNEVKKSKLYKFIMRNFRVPLFIIVVYILFKGYLKIYNLKYFSILISNINILMLFFAVTLFVFLIVSLKTILDSFSLVFGQKGQDTLTRKAKKNK